MVWIVAGVGAAVVLGIIVFLLRRRARRAGELVSVVMLRRSRRELSEADVRAAARRAVDAEARVMSLPLPAGPARGFVVVLGEMPAFYVIDAGRPYGEDVEAESMKFEDPRARAAYAAHVAWVSVDLVGGMPSAGVWPRVREMMCRLAAEFYDEACTMLYAPALERVALAGPEVEGQLKEGRLDDVFGDDGVNQPIVGVESGDARVEAAIAEARRRWPEFVAVWERLGTASKALVKAPFDHEGGREWMWIEVAAVENGSVTGQLVNEPAHVRLRKGEVVTVAAAEVGDWAIVDGERARGMFVEKVLRGA